MKKLLVALMIASMLFVLFSCTESAKETAEKSSIKLNTDGRTAGGSDDETLKWTDCIIADVQFTQGSDGFVLGKSVDITFGEGASITITAYTDAEDENGTQLDNTQVDQKLKIGGEEGSWTLTSNITPVEGVSLENYTSYKLTINDSSLTFAYTPDTDGAEPIEITAELNTTYTRTVKDSSGGAGETTDTTLTLTSKGSGGGTDTSLKWNQVELATIEVATGTDEFDMSTSVTVTIDSNEHVAVKAYTDSAATSGEDDLELDKEITLTLYVGGGEEAWTLKYDIEDVDQNGGPIAGGTYKSYTVTLNNAVLTFDDGSGHTIDVTANMTYTRKTQ